MEEIITRYRVCSNGHITEPMPDSNHDSWFKCSVCDRRLVESPETTALCEKVRKLEKEIKLLEGIVDGMHAREYGVTPLDKMALDVAGELMREQISSTSPEERQQLRDMTRRRLMERIKESKKGRR